MTFFVTEIFFLRPEVFWLALPLCGLVYLVFKPKRSRQASGWEQLIDQDLLVYFGLHNSTQKSKWGANLARIFLLISCLLAIIGLAGPAFKGEGVQKLSSSSVVYLILDTTWSMQATDLKPTRLDFAKRKIANLLEANPESQFALLVYAEDSFVVVPPTPDKNAILHLLDDIDPSIMPSFGNRPESIAKSLKKTIQAQDRQQQAISLILITDEIPEGKIPLALDALSAYKDLPWTIWHFGISEAPLLNPQNKKPLVDRSGKPVLGTANLAANQEFADKLQADFLQASLNNADVQRLSGWLAGNFEATERALEEDASGTIEIGYWLAIPLLVASFLLMSKPHLLGIALVFMAFATPQAQASFLDKLLNDNQKGHIAFLRGDYQKAQELLSNQELKNYSGFLSGDYQQDQALSPNPSIQEIYNAITTKAFAGKAQEALEGYEELLEKYELPEEIKTKVEENIAVLEEFLAQQQQQNQDRDGQNQEQQNQQQENQEQAGEDGQQQNQQNQQDGQNSSASQEQQPQPPQQAENRAQENQQAKEEFAENPQDDTVAEQGQDTQEQQPQPPQQAENRAQENQQAKEEFAENPQDDTVAEQGQDTQEQQALEGQSQENEQVQQAQAEKDAETTISQQNQPAQETTAAPLNYSEQYQKLIEDDPGTLLKRKFYLEKRRQARSGKRPSTNILDGL